GGASSDNQRCYEVSKGGRLLVQDIWYETRDPQCPQFVYLTNSGTFTLHGAMVAPQYSEVEPPAVCVENFRGQFTLLTTSLAPTNTRVSVRGEGARTRVLLLGLLGGQPPECPATRVKFADLKNVGSTAGGGGDYLADAGDADPRFLRQMLRLTRQERPAPI